MKCVFRLLRIKEQLGSDAADFQFFGPFQISLKPRDKTQLPVMVDPQAETLGLGPNAEITIQGVES